MGLDLFDLVLEMEDRFGIVLHEEEFSEIVRVEDLTTLVLTRVALARVSDQRKPDCRCVRAFLTLRGDVRKVMGDAAFRFRPSQQIADLLPPRKRKQLWNLLENRLLNLPRLKRPIPLRVALIALSLLLLGVCIIPALSSAAILPLSLLCAGVAADLLYLLTHPFRVVPPPAMTTFGDAIRRLAGTIETFESTARKSPEWIAEAVQQLVAETLGIDRASVVPTARLIEDLGAN